MPRKPIFPAGNAKLLCLFIILFQFIVPESQAQMRQLFSDIRGAEENFPNEIVKLNFYSSSEGYVAFKEWIGYTQDSGRTFTRKYISMGNVDYGAYLLDVNLTGGFGISGLKAFDQNNIIVYGNYFGQNAILTSSDGGSTFKLVYLAPLDINNLTSGIKDMVFPQNGNIGYASDLSRILKTANKGASWVVISSASGADYQNFYGIDNNNVYVVDGRESGSKLLKTTDGVSFNPVTLPAGDLWASYFTTGGLGWVNMSGGKLYKTLNGGASWTRVNTDMVPFYGAAMKFVNTDTAYALGGGFTVIRTIDGGKYWERLPRDNNYAFQYKEFRDIQVYNGKQLWAGGGQGFLEMTSNGGGNITYPKAYFSIDTTGVAYSGNVKLLNYSKAGYTSQWYKSGTLISTAYNASYIHDLYKLKDTISLVVSNGTYTDTLTQYQDFPPPAAITSFTPDTAASATTVTINGANFEGVTGVYFGATPAASFKVVTPSIITAVVGNGSSGSIRVETLTKGITSLPGFVFLPPPVITSFTPTSAAAGTTITITGQYFKDVLSVTIGGLPVTWQIVSSTTIAAIVPSGISGAIVIKTKGGTVQQDGFIALPSLKAFQPQQGTQGTIIRISGSSLGEVTGISIGGIPVRSFNRISADSITAIVGAGGSGDVLLSAPGGTTALPGFVYFPLPSIASFSPVSGPVGTVVTIAGANFNPVAANNIVSFGGVKATVTAGTINSLTVIVPPGSTQRPITVTSNNLIAFSAQPFRPVFSGGSYLTPNSFDTTEVGVYGKPPYYNGDMTYFNAVATDLDGDGKTDIAGALNNFGPNLMLLRNTSTTQKVSFSLVENRMMTTFYLAVGDLDGDAKPDMVIVNGSSVSVKCNSSTIGNIAFDGSSWGYSTSGTINRLFINDMDKDGKPDIITVNPQGIGICRNIGDPGVLNFEGTSYPVGGENTIVADIDLDGKPDLIFTDRANNKVQVIRNTSTPGQISFAAPVMLTSHAPYLAAAGDLDNDGMPDIAVVTTDGKLVVYRNTGTVGTVAFATPVEYDAILDPRGIKLADLDGNGKLDILVSHFNYHFTTFPNNSTPGNIEFDKEVLNMPVSLKYGFDFDVADLNGDNKPDPIMSGEQSKGLIIYVNKSDLSRPFIRSFTPATAGQGAEVTIHGGHFTGVNAVSFGGVAAGSFTMVNDTTITAVVGAGASGIVSVTNNGGTHVRDGFTFIGNQQPVITAISPMSGPVGSTVTITGTGFGATPADNIVYFGNVRTQVVTASSTELKVMVPTGASPDFINITTNHLTAYAAKSFTVTFQGSTNGFSSNSFNQAFTSIDGTSSNLADIDADGKSDLLLSGTTANKRILTVARNTGSPGNIAFETPIGIDPGYNSLGTATGDLNGDGKTDIVSLDAASNTVRILINTSSAAGISFMQGGTLRISNENTSGNGVVINDMDGDGKPDIIASNYESYKATIFRNISTSNGLYFATGIQYQSNGYASYVGVADLDGDNKPELLIGASNFLNDGLMIFRNTCTPGMLSFQPTTYPLGVSGFTKSAVFSDFNGDGKPDVIAVGPNSNYSIQNIYINNGSPGNIVFGFAPLSFQAIRPVYISAGDLDGDGRPEFGVVNGSGAFDLYKNTSNNGVLSLADKAGTVISAGETVKMGDMDNDGVLDLVAADYTGIKIYRNLMGEYVAPAYTIRLCIFGDTTLGAGVNGKKYQWQEDVGYGFMNRSDDSFTKGTNTANLRLIDLDYSKNNYKYRCIIDDTVKGSVYTIAINLGTVIKPAVSVSTPLTTICKGSSISFIATPVNGGANPTWAWRVNGNLTGAVTATYTTDSLANGDRVQAMLVSSESCALSAPVYSNTIEMSVTGALTPSVSIVSSANTICPGTAVTFTATPANGGNAPVYQWQVNGVNVSSNTNTYTTSGLVNGDQVKVLLTSNAACALQTPVSSNNIQVTVNASVTPAVSITASGTGVCSGTAITFTATPVNGGNAPVYQWQVNGVNVGANTNTYSSTTLKDGDKVRVLMTGNNTCAVPGQVSSNIITMAIGTSIVPDVSIAASASNICPGTSVTFTATPVNGGSTPVYQWQVNGVNAGGNSNTYTSNSLVNGDQVKVLLTSNAACALQTPVASNTIPVTVNTSVTPAVSIAASGTGVCSGTAITFTATPVNGGNAPVYQWQVNGVNVGANANIYSSATLKDGDKVGVLMIGNNTCAVSGQVSSNVITVTIGAAIVPAVNIIASQSTICTGATVTFTATPVNGGNAPTYQWMKNGNQAPGAASSPTYTTSALQTGDTIKLLMTSNATCASPVSVVSNGIGIKLLSTGVAPTVAIVGNTDVATGTPTTLTAYVLNGGNAPVYQWQDSTAIHDWKNITGGISATLGYTPVATGDKVRMQFTSNTSCAGTATITSNTLMFTLQLSARLSPNPVDGILIIDGLKLSENWQTLEIRSASIGNSVVVQNIAHQTRISLPVSQLASGVYVAVLRSSTGETVLIKFYKR